MKHLLRGLLIALLTVGFFSSSTAQAIEANTPAPWLDESPLIITARYSAGQMPVYFEIYNEGSEAVLLNDWVVKITWKDASNNTTSTTKPFIDDADQADVGRVFYLPPKGYAVIGFNGLVDNALLPQKINTPNSGIMLSEISLQTSKFRPAVLVPKVADDGKKLRLVQGATSYNASYFESAALYQDEKLYEVPEGEFPLSPIEILANPKSCAPASTDISCREYVKFYNDTNADISFDGTRLRIGDFASAKSIRLSGTIKKGQYVVISETETGAPLSIANAGGYVWLEDSYGLKVYESTITEYVDASSTIRKGQSWAKFSTGWDWAKPNPVGANTQLSVEEELGKGSSGHVPCRSDQFRNPLTNRCKLISSSSSLLQSCAANQYRNPETNRCRLLASNSSLSALKACASNQIRNPETNRCKLIATTASSLKPCVANQERNPETNRCRKVASSTIPNVDHALEEMADGRSSPIGWVAFASVGSLAAGYGVWEWRRELTKSLKKIMGVFKK